MTALRCAIYTRVSSDSGLEQDFNSLDAQHESAEAYIKSQTHEGWRLVRERFDDGGFSGGSLERPALQRLMARISQGRIDIVVVYKVDRLTRSLADFAKLVEHFDAHRVSFVSVTQSFNTTSSMGRLTLNVLLSFAQFEREVTGERIRDKIAASKRKGLWMGGGVPHGYRVENRKLIVVEEEAAEVRSIFNLYLSLGSVRTVQSELAARNVRTRIRTLSSGRTIGGVHFTNGPLAHILTNRHYIGEIGHKGQFFPSEHPAIVARDVFDRVQERLLGQRRFRLADRARSRALLLGKLFNDAGERLTPSYAMKNAVRYRYYISVSAMQSRTRSNSSVHRVAADPIERIVIEALCKLAPPGNAADNVWSQPHLPAAANPQGNKPVTSLTRTDAANAARPMIEQWLDRAVVHHERVEIILLAGAEVDFLPQTLIVPWTKPTQTRHREVLQPVEPAASTRLMEGAERARLVRAIGLAFQWLKELIDGTVADLAAISARERKSERSIRMTLSLAFLDPALIQAAAEGRLPRGYGVTRLADLPPRFEDQWAALALTRPS